MRENISLLDSYLIRATSWAFHCFRKWPSIFLQGAVPFGGRTKPCIALWLFLDWPYKQSSYNFQYYNHVLTLMIEHHFVCCTYWSVHIPPQLSEPYFILHHRTLYILCCINSYCDTCICWHLLHLLQYSFFQIQHHTVPIPSNLITIKVSFIQRRRRGGRAHWDFGCRSLLQMKMDPLGYILFTCPPYSIPVR